MDINDIPETENNTPDLPDFDSKEGFLKLRQKMLTSLYNALEDEPNAQIIKQVREILAEADVEILDREKGMSEALRLLTQSSDDDIAEELFN